MGTIMLARETCDLVRSNLVTKGNVLEVAQIAGIQAAKRTGELIPLCHPLGLDFVDVQLDLGEDRVTAISEARCTASTGVEMEALTSVASRFWGFTTRRTNRWPEKCRLRSAKKLSNSSVWWRWPSSTAGVQSPWENAVSDLQSPDGTGKRQ
jgi:hypothetical protein